MVVEEMNGKVEGSMFFFQKKDIVLGRFNAAMSRSLRGELAEDSGGRELRTCVSLGKVGNRLLVVGRELG